MSAPIITVLAGGISTEREVSLGSGRASALALARALPTRLLEVTTAALPSGLDPARDVVFSTLHGTFGEDGGMQQLLDAAGIEYAGCDAVSSALTMDKSATKARAAAAGVRVAEGMPFASNARPSATELVARLGPRVVLKPNAEGSSVGLSLPEGPDAIDAALAGITAGTGWRNGAFPGGNFPSAFSRAARSAWSRSGPVRGSTISPASTRAG